jgi:hypothetical protein
MVGRRPVEGDFVERVSQRAYGFWKSAVVQRFSSDWSRSAYRLATHLSIESGQADSIGP